MQGACSLLRWQPEPSWQLVELNSSWRSLEEAQQLYNERSLHLPCTAVQWEEPAFAVEQAAVLWSRQNHVWHWLWPMRTAKHDLLGFAAALGLIHGKRLLICTNRFHADSCCAAAVISLQ